MPSLVLLYLKGIAMGAADVVPGVSGGTIAFISGIYEELLLAVRSFDARAARLFWRREFRALWRHLHGTFLCVLLAGIGTSLLLFSRVILHLLSHFPVLVWAFFFGLIVASILAVARRIGEYSPAVLGFALAGAGAGYYITVAVPARTPEALWFIFLSGMIAICAMILPGISGSFILVLLSKYEYVFTAIRDFNLGVMAVFGCGCVVGLLSFSHLLSWTLRRWHAPTIAFLTGLMIGSLNKVWPWKLVVETFVSSSGAVKPLLERNVLPGSYLEATGNPPYLAGAVLLAVLGFLVVFAIDRISSRTSVVAVIHERELRIRSESDASGSR